MKQFGLLSQLQTVVLNDTFSSHQDCLMSRKSNFCNKKNKNKVTVDQFNNFKVISFKKFTDAKHLNGGIK